MTEQQIVIEGIEDIEPAEEFYKTEDISIDGTVETGYAACELMSEYFDSETVRVYQNLGLADIQLCVDAAGDGIGTFATSVGLSADEAKALGAALIDAASDQ